MNDDSYLKNNKNTGKKFVPHIVLRSFICPNHFLVFMFNLLSSRESRLRLIVRTSDNRRIDLLRYLFLEFLQFSIPLEHQYTYCYIMLEILKEIRSPTAHRSTTGTKLMHRPAPQSHRDISRKQIFVSSFPS